MDKCMICGQQATEYFAGNKNLPLCGLPSCEVALINEINDEIKAVVEAAKEVQ